jgi:hypothetical protein
MMRARLVVMGAEFYSRAVLLPPRPRGRDGDLVGKSATAPDDQRLKMTHGSVLAPTLRLTWGRRHQRNPLLPR